MPDKIKIATPKYGSFPQNVFTNPINEKVTPKNGIMIYLIIIFVFLLYRYSLNFGSYIPFLTFNFVTHTHKLNPSPYYRQLSKDREKLHTQIIKLHHKGWGYTKIHHHLIKNNYNIGNSRTTVDYIIKKRLERDRFFNQEITEEYRNFDIEFYRIEKEEL